MSNLLNLLTEDKSKTCFILENNKVIFSSEERGVKPILDFYKEYRDTKNNLIVVDKIMGRGAVILAKLINATTIITPMISTSALELANLYNMNVTFDKEVDYIINREQNGRCPIETSVLNITDEQVGYKAITDAIDILMKR